MGSQYNMGPHKYSTVPYLATSHEMNHISFLDTPIHNSEVHNDTSVGIEVTVQCKEIKYHR